jgi:hypothetical protein
MEKTIHNRRKRVQAKRQDVVESATAIIEAIAKRRIDAYEGWQQVSGMFQKNAGLGLPEPQGSHEKRPTVITSKPANGSGLGLGCFTLPPPEEASLFSCANSVDRI